VTSDQGNASGNNDASINQDAPEPTDAPETTSAAASSSASVEDESTQVMPSSSPGIDGAAALTPADDDDAGTTVLKPAASQPSPPAPTAEDEHTQAHPDDEGQGVPDQLQQICAPEMRPDLDAGGGQRRHYHHDRHGHQECDHPGGHWPIAHL
jgi:hypothetical protein